MQDREEKMKKDQDERRLAQREKDSQKREATEFRIR